MTDQAEKVIFWVDVETNGTKPHEGDVLLEVAMLVTDLDFNILDEEGYHALIRYDQHEVSVIKNNTTPFVLDMHNASGLWDRLHLGKERDVVDRELLAYMKRFEDRPKKANIGGNSITLDRNFMEKYLPNSFDHAGYRSDDVSTVAAWVRRWMGPEYVFEKNKNHEAMADIRESIEEAKFLRKVAFIAVAQMK